MSSKKEDRNDLKKKKAQSQRDMYDDAVSRGTLERELIEAWTVLSTPLPARYGHAMNPEARTGILVEGMVNGGIPIQHVDSTILKHLLELVDAGVINTHEVIKLETGNGLSKSAMRSLTSKIEVEIFKAAQNRLFHSIVSRERVRQWKESTPWYKRIFRRKP